MHATVRVNILTPKRGLGLADFVTQIPFTPTTGMEFVGGPWQDCKKVVSVTYSLEDPSFLIYLDPDEIEENDGPSYAKAYRDTGWSLVGMIADM